MYDPGPLRGQGEPSRCELAKFVIHPDVERNERGLAAHRHQLEAGRGSRAGCGGVVRSGSTTWPSAVDSTGDRKAPIAAIPILRRTIEFDTERSPRKRM